MTTRRKIGGLAGTRTLDQCLKRALLYQLSYQPDREPRNLIEWYRRRKSFPAAHASAHAAKAHGQGESSVSEDGFQKTS